TVLWRALHSRPPRAALCGYCAVVRTPLHSPTTDDAVPPTCLQPLPPLVSWHSSLLARKVLAPNDVDHCGAGHHRRQAKGRRRTSLLLRMEKAAAAGWHPVSPVSRIGETTGRCRKAGTTHRRNAFRPSTSHRTTW